jgi:ligand-binding sensor domain-containing protein
MKRLLIPAIMAVCVLRASSLTPDTGAHSDSTGTASATHYRLYTAGGPVLAFDVQADVIWCALESSVIAIPLNGEKKTAYPALGTMPAQSIEAIAADRQGRIWFGGPQGIAMKNGPKFTDFTTKSGLSGNRVNAIAAADDGSVWVGTDSGACVFIGETWKQFTVKDGLVSDRIQAIAVDDKGRVWFGTDKGISVFNGATWTSYTTQNGMSDNDDTRALAYDRNKGVLWAAVGDKDVNTFDGQKWNIYMDTQAGIRTIMVDSQSRIWFGFGTGKGILKFNGDDWLPDPTPFGVPISQTYQMRCDEKGNLWFATDQGVIHLVNPYPF